MRYRGAVSTLSRHYASTLATNLFILFFGVVSGTLAARLLGPAGRGELAVITLWPMALASFGALGLNQALTFHAARQPARRPALFTASLALAGVQSAVLLSVCYFLLPPLLAKQRPLVLLLAQLFMLYIPLAFFSGYLHNLLQGSMHLGAYNLARVFVAAWYALLVTALFLFHLPSLGMIIAGQVAGYAAGLVLIAYWVRRYLRPRLEWDRTVFPPLLSYGVKSHLGSLTQYLNLRLDQLVMSVWLPPTDLGLYVAAVTLASPLTVLPTAFGIVTLPVAAGETASGARAVIRQSFRSVVLWVTAGAAGLFFLAPYLLPLFFGQAFAPATAACRVLAVAMIPLGLSQVLYDSLRGLNRPLAPAYAELVGNAVTVVLLWFLLPRLGFLGAAYASLAAYTVSFLFVLWYSHSRVGLSPAELLWAGTSKRALREEASQASPGQDLQP